jgi:hypothetical protein
VRTSYLFFWFIGSWRQKEMMENATSFLDVCYTTIADSLAYFFFSLSSPTESFPPHPIAKTTATGVAKSTNQQTTGARRA